MLHQIDQARSNSFAPVTANEFHAGLNSADRDALLLIEKRVMVPRGYVFVSAETIPTEIFIHLSGSAHIYARHGSEPQKIVAEITPGGVLGLIEALADRSAGFTLVAATDCECIAIAIDDFLRFGRERPEFLLYLVRSMGRHYGQLLGELR